MPFRRLRRRHTMTGPPAPGSTPVHANDPGYKDPVEEMQKRKEDEEAKARQMITSDLLSFCVYLLQSLLSLIIALIYYNSSEDTESQEEAEEIEEDISTEEERGADDNKKRYQKVVVANSVVDMFNSYKDAPASPNKKGELMKLIEKKQSDELARPTEELLKAAKKNKLSQNEAKDINLQSMMYLS